MMDLKDRWQSLSPREQVLIGLMLAILGGTLLWLAVYRPVMAARHRAITTYQAAALEAAEIDAAVAFVSRLQQDTDRPVAAPPDEASIRAIVSQTTRQSGLALTRLQPDSNSDGLTVWFDKADAKLVLRWVRQLYQQHGIAARRVSLQRGDDHSVRAEFLLEPGQANQTRVGTRNRRQNKEIERGQ